MAVCIFDHLLPPWPPVESSYRGWYHHLFKLLLCLSCCLRENNGSHQQKELKKVHPEVFLLHSESFSSSACVKSFRSCFSCVIMNMGEKKGARMFWGTLLTSKVGANFLGAECLMTRVCVRFAYSSHVMRCTFRCLMGEIPRCLQLTQIWLFIGPEMYLSSYLGLVRPMHKTHKKQIILLPLSCIYEVQLMNMHFSVFKWTEVTQSSCQGPLCHQRDQIVTVSWFPAHKSIWQYVRWIWHENDTGGKVTIAVTPGSAKRELGC